MSSPTEIHRSSTLSSLMVMTVMMRGSRQHRKIHRFWRPCCVSSLVALVTLQRQLDLLLQLHLDVQDASPRPLTFRDGLELTLTTTTSDFSSFLFTFWCLTPKGEKIRGVNFFRDLAALHVLSFESSLLACEREQLKKTTLLYVYRYLISLFALDMDMFLRPAVLLFSFCSLCCFSSLVSAVFFCLLSDCWVIGWQCRSMPQQPSSFAV